MDQSWINLSRINDDIERGVEEFLQFAQRNADNVENRVRMKCPCVNCLNGRRFHVAKIR